MYFHFCVTASSIHKVVFNRCQNSDKLSKTFYPTIYGFSKNFRSEDARPDRLRSLGYTWYLSRIKFDKQACQACSTNMYHRKKQIKGETFLWGVEGKKCNLIYSRFGRSSIISHHYSPIQGTRTKKPRFLIFNYFRVYTVPSALRRTRFLSETF